MTEFKCDFIDILLMCKDKPRKEKSALCICQKIYYSNRMKGYASFMRNVRNL